MSPSPSTDAGGRNAATAPPNWWRVEGCAGGRHAATAQRLPIEQFADVLLKLDTVLILRGIRPSKHYADIAAGLWPRPIKLSPRCARYPASECRAINAARIAGATDDEVRALVKRLEAARKLVA
jgi:prophage regulatory protein